MLSTFGFHVPDAVFTGGAWLTIGLLSVWSAATLAKAHDPTKDKLQGYLGLGAMFIPSYNFFAPHPGHHDFHLLYRERLEDDSLTRWQECSELTDFPTRSHWIWNPGMYDTKAMFDHTQSITSTLGEKVEADDESADGHDSLVGDGETESPGDLHPDLENVDLDQYVLTLPYLSILNYVTDREHHEDAAEIQYLLMRGSLRDGDSTPVFISYFHEVGA